MAWVGRDLRYHMLKVGRNLLYTLYSTCLFGLLIVYNTIPNGHKRNKKKPEAKKLPSLSM